MHLAKRRRGALAATVIAVASLAGLVAAPSRTVALAAAAARPSVEPAAAEARPRAALAAAVHEPAAPAAGTWRAPVDGVLLRPFRLLPRRFAAGQHRGVDLAAAPGTPVRAACGGRVRFAGRVPGGGLTLSIGCGTVVATYQHLDAIAVHRGERVAPGSRIATVGRARPRPHLHLGARVAATGAYLDPLRLLARPPRGAPPVAPGAPVRVAVPSRHDPRSPILARAPRLGHAPSPVASPLGPAPLPAGVPRLGSPSTEPIPAPALPWSVWLGLALFGLGLPIRGLLVLRRRARLRAVAKVAS